MLLFEVELNRTVVRRWTCAVPRCCYVVSCDYSTVFRCYVLSCVSTGDKCSKNFDERPHRRGIFNWENLMWHSTVSAAGQLECWSRACREILTSGALGMVLGSVLENPGIIPSKVPLPVGRSGPLSIRSSLGPPKSTFQMAYRSVQPFLQGSQSLQADRATDRRAISHAS